MKKLIRFAILALLLITILSACTVTIEYDTTVEDYRELEAIFLTPEDGTFTGAFFIDLLDAEGAAVRYDTTGVRAFGPDAFQASYAFAEPNGTPIFEVRVIDIDDQVYMSTEHLLDIWLESWGLFDDPDLLGDVDLSLEALLGESHYYVDITSDEPPRDDLFCICDIFSDEELERYLSREDDVFTITIEGDAVRSILERYMEGFLSEFALGGLGFVVGVIPEISDFMEEAREHPARIVRGDLTGARIVIERSQSGNTLYQTLDLYIPGRVHMTADRAQVMGETPPISPPELYLPIEEFADRIGEAIADVIMSAQAPGELEIVHDLDGFTLLGHDLSGSSFLEHYELWAGPSGSYDVTVITGGELHRFGLGGIFWDAWAIELYYIIVPDSDVVSVITEIFERDQEFIFELYNVDISVGPLRVSADDQTAILSASTIFFDSPVIYLYLAEAIPDTDYILSLELVFFLGLFGPEDFNILMELSDHIGIDLMEHLMGSLGATSTERF